MIRINQTKIVHTGLFLIFKSIEEKRLAFGVNWIVNNSNCTDKQVLKRCIFFKYLIIKGILSLRVNSNAREIYSTPYIVLGCELSL
jgi:hypothetical protein